MSCCHKISIVTGFMFCFADNAGDKHVSVNFVQDTSKFWYKADISREQGVWARGDPGGERPRLGTSLGHGLGQGLRFVTCLCRKRTSRFLWQKLGVNEGAGQMRALAVSMAACPWAFRWLPPPAAHGRWQWSLRIVTGRCSLCPRPGREPQGREEGQKCPRYASLCTCGCPHRKDNSFFPKDTGEVSRRGVASWGRGGVSPHPDAAWAGSQGEGCGCMYSV